MKIDVANEKYFDEWSKNYDSKKMSSWFQNTQKCAIDYLSLKNTSKVLDVGCGTGFAVHYLGSILNDGKACGIDISSGMIKRAKEKTPKGCYSVEFQHASSDKIPYQDDCFDGIICTNSFHHYPDPLKALGEMKRVLKPGGELIILDSARNLSPYVWLWDRFLRWFEKGHIKYYSTRELEKLLNQSEFKTVNLKFAKNEFMPKGKLFSSLQLWSAEK